ncbi:peptide chain release factor 1-like, mitochondrial [Pecten maximus]|uniref:peptide chain release factor 1-like, mitochondrial n=1 Tax=Pecten maximus TaxID=6579 RepID=UPI001457F0C6|nr:peptide chain release factor 1-like, mitochondrial [Pecten maximus]
MASSFTPKKSFLKIWRLTGKVTRSFQQFNQQRRFPEGLNKENDYYRTLSKIKHVFCHPFVKRTPSCLNGRLSICKRTFSSQICNKPSSCIYLCGVHKVQRCLLLSSDVEQTAGFIHVRGYSSSASRVSFELFQKYLDKLNDEHVDLQKKSHMKKSEMRRMQSLEPVLELRQDFLQKLTDYETLETLISGLGPDDEEIRYMAEQEKREYRTQIEELKQQILSCIIPEESTDKNDIILEVSQGIGGQEAMLFAADLFEMYRGVARYKNWEFQENVYDDETVTGGIRKASASIRGENVYKFFKFESGVHRVQRVPATEQQGRVHTSTATVAVLPQPTEIDMMIDPKEIKVETTTATGKGGQHVNKTESAVRLTHLPTGIVVYCQRERSQVINKVIAMEQLRTKVYARHLKAQVLEYKAQRQLQVGSAARSEKIRTYNFNQDRITDHRLHENLFNIDTFFKGGEDMDFLNKKLQETAREDIIEEILDQFEIKDTKKISKKK